MNVKDPKTQKTPMILTGQSNNQNSSQGIGDETNIPLIPNIGEGYWNNQVNQKSLNSLQENTYLQNFVSKSQNKVSNLQLKKNKSYTELTQSQRQIYDQKEAEEEKLKSELRGLQQNLDNIQDKNSSEYKNILKIALQKLILLINLQPFRKNVKSEKAKKDDKKEGENLKEGVEIEWTKGLGKSSIQKSQKGLMSQAMKQAEIYAQGAFNIVEEALLNEVDAKALTLKKEEERQDVIWKDIMQRTLKNQGIVNESELIKPTFEKLKSTANVQMLKNPESYYDSLNKESVWFELHQSTGYIYLAQVISFVSSSCRFYLIQKYSLDLGDNEFKKSGCFAIQTPVNQKFNSLSIFMRGKSTYFFNFQKNEKNKSVLQLYKHTENAANGEIDIVKDYQIALNSDQPYKVEFMIDLSQSQKVQVKEIDFLNSQYILVTQLDSEKDEAGVINLQIKVYNFSHEEQLMLQQKKPSVEGKDDNVGFFRNLSETETRFFFYFKNKFQMYVDYDYRKPQEQQSAQDNFPYKEDAEFLSSHFKRWQAQSFRIENTEIKKQDFDQQVEIVFFLVLNNKSQVSYVQLWSTNQDKKIKKHMEKFMAQEIKKRKTTQDLINNRVEQLKGQSYFLLNNHKVIAYNEEQIQMLFLKDFSKAKSNFDYHDPSFNNIFLYQAPVDNKIALYSHQYACENANNLENRSLFLHKTKQKVIYGCHQIFVNQYDQVKNLRPILQISKEWIFIDTKNDGNLTIIYLGDQSHLKDENKYACFWYHVSPVSKVVTLFLKRGLEITLSQPSIHEVQKSSIEHQGQPLIHLNTIFNFPEFLFNEEKIKAIQFEQVTDLARAEDNYIKFITYLQTENEKSAILGYAYFCRAHVSQILKPGGIISKEIPIDYNFLNKFAPNRKQNLTLLFASCSPLFIKQSNRVEQSFQIGFTHYDEKKFQDCVDIYEYQTVLNPKLIDLKLKKSYLIISHKKIHQDEDNQGNHFQRQILVPIIDQNGEPSANQVLFQGKKFEGQKQDEELSDYGEYDDEDEYGEASQDADAGEDNDYGGEGTNEGGSQEINQVNFLLPLDQDNCNKYRTKIIRASYKHFGFNSRALFSVLASAIQLPLLKKDAFSEQEKLYLLNQSLNNLLCMSEPTFGELFGEIYQQNNNHIQEIFQPRFIRKGFNKFAINLKAKTFDQSDLNSIFKQLKDYDFAKQKSFVPTNSIIERSTKSLHLVGLFNVNILFDLQAGFSHQSLIEWAFQCTNFPALVEIVRLIQRQKFHNLNRKMIFMTDLPQLMSDPKISMREFLNRDMSPLLEEEEEKIVNIADLLEDIELPTISDKQREYFELRSTGFDEQKQEILTQVLENLNKGDLNEAEEVNFIYIDFFMTTLKLKIDVIKNRQANNSTEYLNFFFSLPYKFINCNEIFMAGLICQRSDQEIFNYNIIQKIIERQELKFSMIGTKVLWFFYALGFYAPYVITICLRHTYRGDFKDYGITQYEGGQQALQTIYVLRAIAGFTQLFYFYFELEEFSFSGKSYFQSPSNIADFSNPFLYAAHVVLNSIILERDTQIYSTLDIVNSYIEVLLIIVSSVKFLNLAKSFEQYQMLVEMVFAVIRQIQPLLALYLFALAGLSFCQMVALDEYRVDWNDGEPYPVEYALQPRVGFMWLQTLRNSVGDTKVPYGGVWRSQEWSLSQSFAFFLQWAIYIVSILLVNIIILNFLIIWVGEIYSTVKGGIPYYFQMQAEMNFNYLKSTRHIIRSQNKYNQIWVIKSPLNGLPDNVTADELEGLQDQLTKMQYKIKNKLYKKLDTQHKQLEQSLEGTKQDISDRLFSIESKQKEILELLQINQKK